MMHEQNEPPWESPEDEELTMEDLCASMGHFLMGAEECLARGDLEGVREIFDWMRALLRAAAEEPPEGLSPN